jgi:hypothetical protein
MVGANHKGWSMLFIYTQFSYNFFLFISLLDFYIFCILLLPHAIVGIDHSKDGENWAIFSILFLQNNII